MSQKKQRNRDNRTEVIRAARPLQQIRQGIVLLLLLFVYLLLFHLFRAQVFADSMQYIDMHIRREPGYPLWLWLFRSVTGENPAVTDAVYLSRASLCQCILNAVASWYLGWSLSRIFHRGLLLYESLVCVIAVLPQLMTIFVSESHVYLAGAILSESLAIPVFYFFFVQLLLFLLGQAASPLYTFKDRHAWSSLCFALLLSFLRSQFMAMLIAWGVVLCCRLACAGKGTGARRILCCFLFPLCLLLAAFQLRTALVKTYSYATTGVFSTNSNFWNMALAYVLYNADASMSPAFADNPELQQLFETMCLRMEEEKLGDPYEPEGFVAANDYLEDCYDPIKFDVIESTVFDAANEITPDYQTQNSIENQYSRDILLRLLPLTWPKFIINYLRLAGRGLLRSILAVGSIFTPAAVGIYLVVLVRLVIQMRRLSFWRRRSGYLTAKEETEVPYRRNQANAVKALLLILLLILGNSFGTALVSADLARYMIYTFAPFYSAALLLWTPSSRICHANSRWELNSH